MWDPQSIHEAVSRATDITLRATIILALAGIAALLLRRASAALRHLIWTAAILGLLLLPALVTLLPQWKILPQWPQHSSPVSPATLNPPPSDPTAQPIPSAPAPDWQPQQNASNALPTSASIAVPPHASSPWNWELLTLEIWIAGIPLMLLPMLLAHAALLRLQRRSHQSTNETGLTLLAQVQTELALKKQIILLEGPPDSAPMTFGLLRPTLLVPVASRHWSATHWRMVLRHELAHIRRHDVASQLLAQLARALYWFHPLAWLACARMAAEREAACDDMVLGGGFGAAEYAEQLLAAAAIYGRSDRTTRLACHASVPMARLSTLETRLRAVLDRNCNRRRTTGLLLVTVSFLSLAVIVPMAILRAATAEPPAPIHEPATVDSPAVPTPPAHAAPLLSTEVMSKSENEIAALADKLGFKVKLAPMSVSAGNFHLRLSFDATATQTTSFLEAVEGGKLSVRLESGDLRVSKDNPDDLTATLTLVYTNPPAACVSILPAWRAVLTLQPEQSQMPRVTGITVNAQQATLYGQAASDAEAKAFQQRMSHDPRFSVSQPMPPAGLVDGKYRFPIIFVYLPDIPWGTAVEGFSCRVHTALGAIGAAKFAGQNVAPLLLMDIRNDGTRELFVYQAEEEWTVQWDGVWYKWAGAIEAKSSALGPGRHYESISMDMNVPAGQRQYWEDDQHHLLKLTAGAHKVRVATVCREFPAGKEVRVESNEIEVTATPAATLAGREQSAKLQEEIMATATQAGAMVQALRPLPPNAQNSVRMLASLSGTSAQITDILSAIDNGKIDIQLDDASIRYPKSGADLVDAEVGGVSPAPGNQTLPVLSIWKSIRSLQPAPLGAFEIVQFQSLRDSQWVLVGRAGSEDEAKAYLQRMTQDAHFIGANFDDAPKLNPATGKYTFQINFAYQAINSPASQPAAAAMPNREDSAKLQEEMLKLAAQVGVQIDSIRVAAPETRKPLGYIVSFSGTAAQVTDFYAAIESGKASFQLADAQVQYPKNDTDKVSAEMRLVVAAPNVTSLPFSAIWKALKSLADSGALSIGALQNQPNSTWSLNGTVASELDARALRARVMADPRFTDIRAQLTEVGPPSKQFTFALTFVYHDALATPQPASSPNPTGH